MPEGSAAVVVPVVTTLAVAVKDLLGGASGGLDDLVRTAVGALLNAVGALLGLIVLPAWMLTMMTEKHRARAVIDRRMAPWLKGDAWAIAAIADRAAGAYLRGYVVIAIMVGVLVYLGVNLSPRLGGPTFAEPLALGVLAGATQVVPIVGPFLGLLPAALILPLDPARAGAYLLIYVVARFLGGSLLGLATARAPTRRAPRGPRARRRDARPVRRAVAAAVGADRGDRGQRDPLPARSHVRAATAGRCVAGIARAGSCGGPPTSAGRLRLPTWGAAAFRAANDAVDGSGPHTMTRQVNAHGG